MRALGIDLGERTGWAVGQTIPTKRKVELTACGLVHIKPARFDSIGMRFLRFEKELRVVIETHKPEILFFEEVRAHSAVQAAQIWGGYSASIMRLAEEYKIPYQGIGVSTVKTTATGNHMASKDRMIACAIAMWPEHKLKLADDNTADAAWVLYTGLTRLT